MTHSIIVPADVTQTSSQGVRDDTAELASFALSDAISIRSLSPSRQLPSTGINPSHLNNGSYFGDRPDLANLARLRSHESSRPGIIHEVSEPASPVITEPPRKSPPTSALSEMIRNSPPSEDGGSTDTEDGKLRAVGTPAVTISRGIISQPREYTALLSGQGESNRVGSGFYSSIEDVEGQRESLKTNVGGIIARTKEQGNLVLAKIPSPKTWNKQAIWTYGVRQPVGYVPAVVLGLLLNILDALSYGDCEPIPSR